MKNIPHKVFLEFLGWLSADLPELRNVEVYRLKRSWDGFLEERRRRRTPARSYVRTDIQVGSLWKQRETGKEVRIVEWRDEDIVRVQFAGTGIRRFWIPERVLIECDLVQQQ